MGIEKKVVSIRLDEEFIAELKKIAKIENRPVSNLIETILKQYVALHTCHKNSEAEHK